MSIVVFDTSAILAMLRPEEGGEVVRGLLTSALSTVNGERAVIRVPFMALMETQYLLMRERSSRDVDYFLRLIEQWPAEVIESTPQWRDEAARVKASRGLSLADAWIAALALIEDAELVHKDPEYDRVPGLKALRLPYRRTGRRA